MNETLQGWINLYKPKNISSFGVIRKIKKKFNILNRIIHYNNILFNNFNIIL